MIVKSLILQNFRSYKKATFDFNPQITVIVGPNAAGKTNLIESLFLLATGKSFRSEKEKQLVYFGEAFCRVKGAIGIASQVDTETLEIVVTDKPGEMLRKKYLVNGVPRRRVDFAGKVPAVLFTPLDLDIVSGQPGVRRRFLDEVLEQLDLVYRQALTTYTKALRQRNALLNQVQETGVRDEKRFAYWDDLLIKNGGILTQKREELIGYINNREKKLFPFSLVYDKSVISEDRLAQYKHAEVGAGVTLVGPQRDDVLIQSLNSISKQMEDVKYFCSRGQQRLVTLELKLSQISLFKERLESDPILLLDDIFSELDSTHIGHVLQMMDRCQTILTTTHKEFIETVSLKKMDVIELGK